jgi:hypothetical protein
VKSLADENSEILLRQMFHLGKSPSHNTVGVEGNHKKKKKKAITLKSEFIYIKKKKIQN